ncbi:MAG: TIM barrel protein [Verrucomicrobiota bacterium]
MKLKLVRHLWGVDGTHGYSHYLPRWREVGYEVVEASLRLSPNRPALLRLLKEDGMQWVPQVFSRDFVPGGTVREHLDSLQQQIEECMVYQPVFFNAHSGSDAWSLAQAEDFYGAVLELERRLGVTIAHETHRLRYFGNPWTTRPILERFPTLKLTCDFSHWVCVAERLLPDCGEIIQLAAQHCHHLHARVGYEEGPQVSDPRAPEWGGHLAAHEGWWNQIWKAQIQRGIATCTLTPEFGPAPYLHLLPFTQAPVANLADICDWMAVRERNQFLSLH